jgi:hypothetical protein
MTISGPIGMVIMLPLCETVEPLLPPQAASAKIAAKAGREPKRCVTILVPLFEIRDSWVWQQRNGIK